MVPVLAGNVGNQGMGIWTVPLAEAVIVQEVDPAELPVDGFGDGFDLPKVAQVTFEERGITPSGPDLLGGP